MAAEAEFGWESRACLGPTMDNFPGSLCVKSQNPILGYKDGFLVSPCSDEVNIKAAVTQD